MHSAAMIDIALLDRIQSEINLIIEEDKKLDIPVFSFIKKGVVEKIAYFMAGYVKRSISIGVAGGTASGKSTVTIDTIDRLIDFQNRNNLSSVVSRVNTDDYYYDRSDMVKAAGSFAEFAKNYDLDCPEAFELDLLKLHIEQLMIGKDVWLPKYDMSGTAKRYDNHTLATPSKIIMSEGMYTLTDKVRDVFDFTLFVEVSLEAQKERWYRRANERNLVNADAVYVNAVNKQEVHVTPTKMNADIIVNGEACRDDYQDTVDKFLNVVKELKIDKKLAMV